MNLRRSPSTPSCASENTPGNAAISTGMRVAILGVGIVLAVSFAGAAHAEPTRERIALMLSGQDCPAQQQAVIQRLAGVAGVVQVDMSMIPDHVMIDRTSDRLMAEDFAALVNDAMAAGGLCRAEVMKSCITAGDTHTGVQ